VWIPVLAFFTGGRLGELAYLQKRDVKRSDGRWIIDLTKYILIDDDDDGETQPETKPTDNVPTKQIEAPRKTKNARSKRIVALHESLELLGFLQWVENCPEGFLFPMLHRAQHVSNAASKRFMRLFKEAEIHEPITDVFHSLRHSYRDLMADNDIAEATAEKQLGHTPSTQGRRYGSPLLRPKEVKRLEKMELPEGLSLEPYWRVLDQVLYYGRLVSAERYERDLEGRRDER
jgi:integrase